MPRNNPQVLIGTGRGRSPKHDIFPALASAVTANTIPLGHILRVPSLSETAKTAGICLPAVRNALLKRWPEVSDFISLVFDGASVIPANRLGGFMIITPCDGDTRQDPSYLAAASPVTTSQASELADEVIKIHGREGALAIARLVIQQAGEGE